MPGGGEIKKVLIIGLDSIDVIQPREFDYSGTPAARAVLEKKINFLT